jgi:hypothetical protein
MNAKPRPDYWGNILYETAMGLYMTEEEAKDDSWMGENFFPLYSQETIDNILKQIETLQNQLKEGTNESRTEK